MIISRGLGKVKQKTFNVLSYRSNVVHTAAVAVAGSISFIGLMGPHIAKRIVGPRSPVVFTNCHFRGHVSCYS